MLNYFSLAGFLTAISSLSVGLIVWRKGSPKKTAFLWFLFSLTVSFWGISATGIGMIRDAHQALWAWRLAYAGGVIWTAVLFFHFVLSFCGLSKPKWLSVHYGGGLLCSLLAFTPEFFSGVRWTFDSFYHPVLGRAFVPFLVLWLSSLMWGHVLLYRAAQSADVDKKNQIKTFFVAMVIAYGGSSLGYLPKFGIDVYPWGDFAIALYPVIMAYGILKFRFLAVRVFFRRAFLFAAVYVFLLGICGFGVYVLHKGMPLSSLTAPMLVFEILFFGVILSLGPFLYAFAARQSTFFTENEMAGLTHELKSPLSSIESAIDMLSFEAKRHSGSVRQKEYLDMIDRNSVRLRRYVDDLLLVMGGADRASLRMEPERLDLLCERVISRVRSDAELKSLVLMMDVDKNATCTCDAGRLEQVLSNILSNAVKFTDKGHISLRVIQTAQEFTFVVQDTGVGMAREEAERVFDRFYQGQAGQKKKGTGLGLAIAKLWVEAHGGKIWAESNGEGKGTTVSFTVPK